MLSEDARIEFRPVAELIPAKRNARTHSKAQVAQIARSIEEYGFTSPILLDENGNILAGHGRLAAVKSLGLKTVPCISLRGMSEQQKQAYLLADNKLALNAGWDMEILALELSELTQQGFDASLTGFELPEIDAILSVAEESAPVPSQPENDIPSAPTSAETVTREGDLWLLGRHRLLCGDAKDAAAVGHLVEGERVDAVFTDSPYNVPIAGHVNGMGRNKHREFHEASGEMSRDQFTEFLRTSFTNLAGACRDGAIVFTCMDWRHLRELLAAGYDVFGELKNVCFWNKTNAGMGTFYRSQHEIIAAWKVGTAPHTNNFGLGDKGRYRTNVWTYAGVNTFKSGRDEELALHPTVKPVALVADAIRDVTHRGELVLDTFAGSGTTLIAAEKTGRRSAVLEIDPAYCDVIIRRWQKLTGKEALLFGTNATFEDVKDERLSEPTRGWGTAQ